VSQPVPAAVWEGELKIGSFKIRAYVLEDGRRLLNPDDVARFFVDGGIVLEADARAITEFCHGQGVPENAAAA